jgi:ABC-type sugar transport system substrate-binding protein
MDGDGPKFHDLTTSTGHAMTDAIAAGSVLMQAGTHPPNSSPAASSEGLGVRPGFLQLDLTGGWQQHEQEAIEAASAPGCARERAG